MADVTVIIATHERVATLLRTLGKIRAADPDVPIVVADNGSTDGTAAAVRRMHPGVVVLALERNRGAAARTDAARAARTRYLAFCDDDGWFSPGTLRRAAALLDAHPGVALLNARVLVGERGALDPACALMAVSPVPRLTACPGRAIFAFMAGAAIARRDAFLDAGGYDERYHIGAEESLLALDLLERGWELVYHDELVLHHHPAREGRDPEGRRILVIRNRLWTAWLRHSWPAALRATASLAVRGASDRTARAALAAALRGAGWVARERRPVARAVERLGRDLIRLSA